MENDPIPATQTNPETKPVQRPILDVVAPPTVSVEAAPEPTSRVSEQPVAKTTVPEQANQSEDQEAAQVDEQRPAEDPQAASTVSKSGHRAPVGAIIVAFLVFTGLCGLALMAYLSS